MHVDDDRKRARSVRRTIDVETVTRVAGVLVLDVTDHLYAVALPVSTWGASAPVARDVPKKPSPIAVLAIRFRQAACVSVEYRTNPERWGDMGNLYHALRNPRGFRARATKSADFLRPRRVRAYLQRMTSVGPRTIVAALVALLLVLGATGTGYAAYGKLDAFVVREMIRKDLPKINRCYESALRYEPELTGKVKVRFAVMRKGSVQAVRVLENTTGHEGVERCVARVVGAIRFPSRRYGKPLSFTFPFVFAPQR